MGEPETAGSENAGTDDPHPVADSSLTQTRLPAAPPDAQPAAAQPAPDITSLVLEHHEVLFRYAYRLTGSVSDAEDLTQQAFLVAHQKLDQLRDQQCAKAWLFTVLRNAYLRQFRKPIVAPLGNFEIDPDAIAAELPDRWEVDGELLQLAINELSPEFKVVVLMFYFEECSYRDIAGRLQLPLGTVMSRLSRAKNQLRLRLTEEGSLASAHDGVPLARGQFLTKGRG